MPLRYWIWVGSAKHWLLKASRKALSNQRILEIPSEVFALARFELERHHLVAIAHLARALACRAADRGISEFAVGPGQIDFVATACAQAFYRAGVPCRRQRRQQVDFAGLRLQQHFADGGGGAEVTVDLEWRVGVEHVRVSAAGVVDFRALAALLRSA